VHYLTDVIGGITLGAACVLTVYLIAPTGPAPPVAPAGPRRQRSGSAAGRSVTVTLAVVSVALAAAMLVFALSAVRSLPDPIDPDDRERAVVRRIARQPRLRRFLRQRLDRRTAGGLVLSASLLATFAVALVTGLLLDMVDHSSGLAALDDDVATWGAAHADPAAVGLLRVLTYLGDTPVVVGALLVAGLVDVARHHRVEALLFLGTVIIGEKLIVNGLKEIVDRTRPDVLPLVGWQGPSIPSGNAAAAAAAWPALALLLTRGYLRVVRAATAATAALIAFAVAASRALLGAHWLTDIIAGLTIGYGWFLITALIFGGRAQRLGDPLTTRPSDHRTTGVTTRPIWGVRRALKPGIPAPGSHRRPAATGARQPPGPWSPDSRNSSSIRLRTVNHHLMTTHPGSSIRPAAGDPTPDRGRPEERSTRLDQLEREIAVERD
jgi:undecaprenyl-diphosphatase